MRHTLAGLAALALLTLAAYFYHPESDQLAAAAVCLLLGGLALCLAPAALFVSPPLPPERGLGDEVHRQRRRWLALALGIVCLLLLAERSGARLLSHALDPHISAHGQMALLVGGAALVTLGAGGLRRARLAAAWDTLRAHRREAALLAALTLAAFAVRAWDLDGQVRAFIDEGPFMWGVVDLRRQPYNPLLAPFHGVASFTRVYPWLQLALSELFGATFGVFRLASALFGALTVPTLYALGRVLYDRPTALLAAAILAAFPPHVHMSRIGLNNIADPLFGVIALACLGRAAQTGGRLWYALAGAALGFLPYFYEGGELLYPALALLWAGWLALTGPPRPALRGLLLAAGGALLIAFPAYYTAAGLGLPLFTRIEARGLGADFWLALLMRPGGLAELGVYWREHLLPPLLHFVHAPDASTFYGGQTALVLPWLVPFFLAGVWAALRRPRGGGALLLLWLALTALGNSLIQFNNWTARFVVAMPAAALLIALGLRTAARLIPTLPLRAHLTPQPLRHLARGSRARRGGGEVLLFAAALAIAAGQVAYYFGPHLDVYRVQVGPLLRHYDAAFRALDLPPGTLAYFTYADGLQAALTYHLFEYTRSDVIYRPVEPDDLPPADAPAGAPLAFFLDLSDTATLDRLRARCALDGPFFSPYPGVPPAEQYALYLCAAP